MLPWCVCFCSPTQSNRVGDFNISFDFKVRMISVVVTEDLSLLTKLATQNLDFLPRGALIEPDRADSSLARLWNGRHHNA